MNRYGNMIDTPRPLAKKPMSDINRAAQFSPFAALTGYDEKVKETARLTDLRIDVADEMRAILDQKLRILGSSISEQPEVDITYFVPDSESHADSKKDGGEYIHHNGKIKKIDSYNKKIVFTDLIEVDIERIVDINSSLFSDFGLESI